MTEAIQRRQRRSIRDPRGSFRMTERDVEILRRVGRHRFLNTNHVASLIDASLPKTRLRLNHLFHHGYLSRPQNQWANFVRGENRPLVYALDRRGAKLLAEQGEHYPHDSVRDSYLEHGLLVSDVLVSLEAACLRHGARFIPFEEILAESPPSTRERSSRDATKISVDLEAYDKLWRDLAVYPDAIFGIHFAGEKVPAFFFLEADRGTETVFSRNLGRPSIWKKLLVYYHAWKRWRREPKIAPFGFKNARVLTVVSTKAEPGERVENIYRQSRELPPRDGSGLFLFADHPSFAASDPFEHLWLSGKGEETSLRD